MIAAFLIVFREAIEAGLIIGVMLAATRGLAGARGWIGAGVLAGVVGAIGVAIGFGALSQAFAGAGQEVFNAVILALATAMLIWHIVWMAQHGREMAQAIRAHGAAVRSGDAPLAGLAIVVGVAVLREGVEVALFLYGLTASHSEGASALVLGGLAGLVAAGGLGAIIYAGLLRIPPGRLLSATSALLALLAAGMAAQAVRMLEQANWVTLLQGDAWDSSALLTESSLVGRMLHTLIGYAERPTFAQLIAYLCVLAATALLARWFAPSRERGARPA